jgi:2-(1,2-epoxy-1,2-dihydrophenyl)acetyl-CoA isomerase
MSEAVLYDIRESVATVTLNRPDALNAFDDSLRVGLLHALQKATADETVRAVVLTGAGRAFSAGADLRSIGGSENLGERVSRQLREEYNPSILMIAQMPKPVVAAVHGFATGIGLGYVLACDAVVMGRSAFFQIPFARIGLVPDGGVTWQITQALGPRLAFEMALAGDKIPAERCLQLGLANRVVEDDQVLGTATEWAQRLTQAAPIALAGLKRNVRRATTCDLATTMRDEIEAQVRCLDSADFREGVKAFFEKRPPKFTGH